jgi:uncharacterized membrane protein YfcA
VNDALIVAAVAFALAATVQSATGFGFSLISGPLVFAVIEPSAAVGLVLVLSQVVNLLVLFGERRRPQVDWGAVRLALVAAAPGLPLGAVAVRVLPATALRVAVAALVATVVADRIRLHRRGRRRGDGGRPAALAAGFAVGALTTSTATNGPPLAIWLTARGLDPATLRDTVTVLFAIVDLVGVGVLAGVVGTGRTFTHASWLLALVPVCAAGQLAGRRLFLRIPARHFEWVVLGLATAAAAASLASGVT